MIGPRRARCGVCRHSVTARGAKTWRVATRPLIARPRPGPKPNSKSSDAPVGLPDFHVTERSPVQIFDQANAAFEQKSSNSTSALPHPGRLDILQPPTLERGPAGLQRLRLNIHAAEILIGRSRVVRCDCRGSAARRARGCSRPEHPPPPRRPARVSTGRRLSVRVGAGRRRGVGAGRRVSARGGVDQRAGRRGSARINARLRGSARRSCPFAFLPRPGCQLIVDNRGEARFAENPMPGRLPLALGGAIIRRRLSWSPTAPRSLDLAQRVRPGTAPRPGAATAPMSSETTGHAARSFTGATPVPHQSRAVDFTSRYARWCVRDSNGIAESRRRACPQRCDEPFG